MCQKDGAPPDSIVMLSIAIFRIGKHTRNKYMVVICTISSYPPSVVSNDGFAITENLLRASLVLSIYVNAVCATRNVRTLKRIFKYLV